MKKHGVTRVIAVGVCLICLSLSGCAFFEDLWNDVASVIPGLGKDDNKDSTPSSPYAQPQVLCAYFHYFKAGPQRFDQWWMSGRDPKRIAGPERWRRDIWIGRPGDYPYIGIYNNVDDAEIMRWHIRLAKAAGISAFLIYINDWQGERAQTDLMFEVAQQEDFKIALVEHHSFLGVRRLPLLDGQTPPLMPIQYEGYAQIMRLHCQRLGLPLPSNLTDYERPVSRMIRNVPSDGLERGAERIAGMLKRWKAHPAYYRVDGKPMVVIPYINEDLTAGEFQGFVSKIEANVQDDLYVVAIVAPVYWYFYPPAVSGTGLTQDWANAGVDAFTHWTPNGMVTTNQKARLKAMQFNVKDSLKWKKDPMIPIMPGAEDDLWRPGDVPSPQAPRNNGIPWGEQIEAALIAKPRFIFIQAWNEWHEGSQIEPSTEYSDPYLYLQILAQKFNRPWQTPPLPPQRSIDPLRVSYLPY